MLYLAVARFLTACNMFIICYNVAEKPCVASLSLYETLACYSQCYVAVRVSESKRDVNPPGVV